MSQWERWEKLREIDETMGRAMTAVMDRVRTQAPQLSPDNELMNLAGDYAYALRSGGSTAEDDYFLLQVDLWIAQRLGSSPLRSTGLVLRCERCQTVISDDPAVTRLFILTRNTCPNCGALDPTYTIEFPLELELDATVPIEHLRPILAHFSQEADNLYRYGVAPKSKREWAALTQRDQSALKRLSRIEGDGRARDVIAYLDGTKRYPQPVLDTDFPD